MELTTKPCDYCNIENLNERKLKFLNDTVKFYSQSRDLRCSDPPLYGPSHKSPGCAIGRHLGEFDFKSIENVPVSSKLLFPLLPSWMQEMGSYFLMEMQDLHDGNMYWNPNSKGLSKLGREKVKYLTEMYI